MNKSMVRQLINDNGNPAANQFVIKTKKATYFQSYNSVVCKLDGINIVLSMNWDYSNTTRKHLYIFMRQNGYYNLSCANDVRKAIKEGWVTLKKVSSLDIV
jgi:hypothetical protein